MRILAIVLALLIGGALPVQAQDGAPVRRVEVEQAITPLCRFGQAALSWYVANQGIQDVTVNIVTPYGARQQVVPAGAEVGANYRTYIYTGQASIPAGSATVMWWPRPRLGLVEYPAISCTGGMR